MMTEYKKELAEKYWNIISQFIIKDKLTDWDKRYDFVKAYTYLIEYVYKQRAYFMKACERDIVKDEYLDIFNTNQPSKKFD